MYFVSFYGQEPPRLLIQGECLAIMGERESLGHLLLVSLPAQVNEWMVVPCISHRGEYGEEAGLEKGGHFRACEFELFVGLRGVWNWSLNLLGHL